MKMRKIMIVMFVLIGSYAYADSNGTSVVFNQRTDTSLSEVEKLRIQVNALREKLSDRDKELSKLDRKLSDKDVEIKKLNFRIELVKETCNTAVKQLQLEWQRATDLEVMNVELKKKLALMLERAPGFFGD
jgi:peptidoglycan hydrolase CwlO-like protein